MQEQDAPTEYVEESELFGDEEDTSGLYEALDDEPEADGRNHVREVQEQPVTQSPRTEKTASKKSGVKKQVKKTENKEPREETEFERALQRMKRRKKKQFTEQEAAEHVQILLNKMRDAADTDVAALNQGRPATAKLRLVDAVATEVAKPLWAEWFLQEGLLQVLETWLAPLPNGGLPTRTLRTKILALLSTMNINGDLLNGLGLGERLIEMWRHPSETEENRAYIRKIVTSVARPILGLRNAGNVQGEQADAGDANYQPPTKNTSPITAAAGAPKLMNNPMRATIPRARTFKITPRINRAPVKR